ncbi:MAG: alpha-mannosidase, partial [Desertifilum sp. SIO1I2]|nr:alpha-mannosidase [Desertifilum sp. SIO1I2]
MASRTKNVEISKITATIEQLRQLSQVNVQARWQAYLGNLPPQAATAAATWSNWKSLPLNTRNHIAWPKGSQVLWLGQRLLVPPALQGYPVSGLMLRLGLTWWSEFTQVYVNGQLVQEGDLFDSSTRILLSRGVSAGECFDVALRLVSPGHDDGALVRSQCLYESPTGIDPGFVADELTVLFQYLQTFAPEQLPQFSDVLDRLSLARTRDRAEFLQALQNLRQTLIQANWNIGENGKLPDLALLGHAHLDLAWLWPVAETWDAALRTFNSVIKLQKEFPKLTFCHSTPALYDWIEQHRPDLFETIQSLIQAGNWEVVGGLWVEPELNTLSGESLARQILYGQHYCLTKFGQVSKIAWLPDSFGFCWQLPQLLKLGQIEYFVTQKLRWNDTTLFPHQVFWWRSPEGSQILSLMSAPIGEGIDPVKMGNYAVEWQSQTHLKDALWLFGVGDRGGGPTRDMLEIAQRWQTSPFFPKTHFTTAEQYLETLTKTPGEFPIWQDELYLEFHRGCYTSHADQKQFNRNCEQLLYQAELWSSIATLILGQTYPKLAIEQAWKKVLFNQFHDILPGSAIPEVYQDA